MSLSINSIVAVPTGLTAVGDLKVGEKVFDKDGRLTEIVEIGPLKRHKTMTFVTDSGWVVTVALDHPMLLYPQNHTMPAGNVGRQPQPSFPVLKIGLEGSGYWGSEKSRREYIEKSIKGSEWKGFEGQLGVLFSEKKWEEDVEERDELLRAIAASGGIARKHAHPIKQAVVICEDRAAKHRVNRISTGAGQACVRVRTKSGSLLLTRGLVPIGSDRAVQE
jgi:hypothetical protein